VLVFVVAYNAEKTISQVLNRIPGELRDGYGVEILVIDDCSQDETFEQAWQLRNDQSLPFALHVLYNPDNQGYGGNQKIGFHFAIRNGFDFVALIHGDGQYAPECLPELLEPLRSGAADAVFGSRMLRPGTALKGGMPLYKFLGNKVLTAFQNRMLGLHLSEFHSGYRLYRVAALERIPFERNSNDFHFDTEIIIQLAFAGARLKELPIPTYYGDEICHVNGMRYAWNVAATTTRASMQRLNVFYDRKFDCRPHEATNARYELKRGYESVHSVVIEIVPAGARVLDLGCAGGWVAEQLRNKGCWVSAIDTEPLSPAVHLDEFVQHDLNVTPWPVSASALDYVLVLDVIEHLSSPEAFLDELRYRLATSPEARVLISTGNVAFGLTRLMLLLGQFNYGKRGILDLTHKRLFTTGSMKRLLQQSGFDILESRGIPAPFPLALGNSWFARLLVSLNAALARVWPRLFAFQILLTVRARPTLDSLLVRAENESAARLRLSNRRSRAS